jgi:DNA-binding XRE family transcriptional regulator
MGSIISHSPNPTKHPTHEFATEWKNTKLVRKYGANPRFELKQDPELPNDIGGRFGRRLRQIRHERNLTQSEMARRFGIDRTYISDVERGKKSISLPTLEIVARGLEMSLSQLFHGI